MALQPEAEKAIDDVCNEAIIVDDNQMPVDVDLDDTRLSPNIKNIIRTEFDYILRLLKMNTRGYDVFRNWYVDGKIYYHIVIDLKNPSQGIKELRYIDPRKIKKVKKPIKRVNQTSASLGKDGLEKKHEEFFLYQSKGSNTSSQGVMIAPDAIAYCHSGVLDYKNYSKDVITTAKQIFHDIDLSNEDYDYTWDADNYLNINQYLNGIKILYEKLNLSGYNRDVLTWFYDEWVDLNDAIYFNTSFSSSPR